MAKRITIWGSPGSGKSMLACILARALTRNKQKAIIISADNAIPMLPIWMHGQSIDPSMSVGEIFTSIDIDTALVASKVCVHKTFPFIGVIGYATGETPFSYPEYKYDTAMKFISAASKLVDYVIIDCSAQVANVFTPAAIESADVIVRLLTPDLRGANYLKSHKPLLLDPRFRLSEHLSLAGLARPYHAIADMESVTGSLPYISKLDRCAVEGKMLWAFDYISSLYVETLNSILERLSDEQSE